MSALSLAFGSVMTAVVLAAGDPVPAPEVTAAPAASAKGTEPAMARARADASVPFIGGGNATDGQAHRGRLPIIDKERK